MANLSVFSRLSLVMACTLLVPILLQGCSQIRSELLEKTITPPKVSIKTLALTKIEKDSLTVLLRALLYNPNRVDIELTGFDYRLQIGSDSSFSGSKWDRIRLTAQQNTAFDIPARISFKDLKTLYRNQNSKQQLDYDFTADIYVDSAFTKNIHISTQQTGQLPLPLLPTLTLHTIEVDEWGLDQISITLELDLTNRNAYRLEVDKLSYELQIDNQPIVAGDLNHKIELPANKSARANLSHTLQLSRFAKGLVKLIQAGDLKLITLKGAIVLNSSVPELQQLEVPLQFMPQ